MVEIVTPLSLWIQLASAFFLLSGVFGDLLLIRGFLVLAYAMLFINAVVGSPLWPDLTGNDGTLAVDSLIWAIISLWVHGCSLWCLLLDERKVEMTEDEAALWRMFYRTGGLSQRLFHSIVACHLKVVEFDPGQEIPTKDDFYIIYQGQVKMEVFGIHDATHKFNRIMVSGEMFDLNFLGLFVEKTIFERTRIKMNSITKSKLFRIHRDDMKTIAKNSLAKGIWQALLINQLSFIVESYAEQSPISRLADAKRDRIFEPLEPWEEPRSVLAGSGKALTHVVAHVLQYMKASFSPPLPFKGHPTGIRQTQLPTPPQKGTYEQHETPRFHFARKLVSRRMTTTKSISSESASDAGREVVVEDPAPNV
jgi:hypothetical protein